MRRDESTSDVDDELYRELGGHGYDGVHMCDTVRCPKYDEMVVANIGRSFQTGCGYDPLETGCCESPNADHPGEYWCRKCQLQDGNEHEPIEKTNNYTCTNSKMLSIGVEFEVYEAKEQIPLLWIYESSGKEYVKECGPTSQQETYQRENAQTAVFINRPKPKVGPDEDSGDFKQNLVSNLTSNLFLCGITQWTHGDYLDNAQLGAITGTITGVGVEFGPAGVLPSFESERHVRINHPNITKVGSETWVYGDVTRGEGIYECFNKGTCIAPDLCTCKDGYAGYDCKTPLCRHLQPSGHISGCDNGGICVEKFTCKCVQTPSELWVVHEEANRGMTGWTGSDCTMPICMQVRKVMMNALLWLSNTHDQDCIARTTPLSLCINAHHAPGVLRSILHRPSRSTGRRGLFPLFEWWQLYCARLLRMRGGLDGIRLLDSCVRSGGHAVDAGPARHRRRGGHQPVRERSVHHARDSRL
jgi:hypothetical protein